MKQPGQPTDRRIEPRVTKLSNHRVEFKFTGVPVYQLIVRDLSANGAGIVARTDSKILNMIRIGQENEERDFQEQNSSDDYHRGLSKGFSECVKDLSGAVESMRLKGLGMKIIDGQINDCSVDDL